MQLKPSLFIAGMIGSVLLFSACPKKQQNNNSIGSAMPAGGGGNPKLIGEWHAKDGSKLKITPKTFTEADSPEPEDYFVKGDTIYTSFQGNLPYTKYAIKKLDEHNLDLFTPDSVVIAYAK
jgi:hypothetical protein